MKPSLMIMKPSFKTLFIISISFNLLLGGFLVTKCFYKCGNKNKYQGYYNTKMIEQSDISDVNKKLILDTFTAINEDKKTKVADMMSYKQQIAEVLTADNFDVNAFENIKSKMQKLKNQIADNMTSQISKLAQQLSADERNTLYKAMNKDGCKKCFKGKAKQETPVSP